MKFIYNLLLVATLSTNTALASVPGQVNFQGVLHDGSSQLVDGSVNFNFSLFDAISSGNQLWTETHIGVPVSGGRYTVALGSITPIAANILDSAEVYLEISVDSETLSPRQRLLAVPYALKSEQAENVAGISGLFYQQLFQQVDWDGQAIPNDDPLEGLADTDGDGVTNMFDSDNDGDGYLDDVEVSNGTGVNLTTPLITGVIGALVAGSPSAARMTGTGFLAGLSVQVGTESPTPVNVTSTSFDFTVGSEQALGTIAVTVTNANGEPGTGSMTFREQSYYDPKVFITSNVYANALAQSVTGADANCQQEADTSGLPGKFVAWYSDPGAGISAKDRIPPSVGPWRLVDGVLVANDIADLSDGSIAAAIFVDPFENNLTATPYVATNTLASGDFNPNSCAGSNLTQGTVGKNNATDSKWTDSHMESCTASLSYYCFSVPGVVF